MVFTLRPWANHLLVLVDHLRYSPRNTTILPLRCWYYDMGMNTTSLAPTHLRGCIQRIHATLEMSYLLDQDPRVQPARTPEAGRCTLAIRTASPRSFPESSMPVVVRGREGDIITPREAVDASSEGRPEIREECETYIHSGYAQWRTPVV